MSSRRQSWMDEALQKPLIDEHVQKLGTFVEAMADGHIDEQELAAQEKLVVKAIKDVESLLDDNQHAKVTQLLCELTAYNVMQTLSSLQEARPKTTFHG